MKKINWLLFIVLLAAGQVSAQKGRVFRTEQKFTQAQTGIASNSIVDILVHNDAIYLGTGEGLSVSRDDGRSWQTFTQAEGIGQGGVAAMAVNDAVIWVSTAFDSLVPEGELPTGGGLSYSEDGGQTWTHVEQPGPTPVQNVTFDVAIHDDGSVWISSWGGGIQRTFDFGQTWEVVPPDTFLFDPLGNLNHRGFSAISANGALWIGTADGINKSLDNGETWTNIKHSNQASPISGNFVVAMASQNYDGREYLWAATINAVDTSEVRGVSVSNDGGFTWHTTLHNTFPHNFGFDDSVAYVAAEEGLFKSLDFGQTWAKFPEIRDAETNNLYLSDEFFGAGATSNHTLFVGGPDGLAVSRDDGFTWEIQRGTRLPGQDDEPRTFAYPSPFSHSRHNQLGGDGHLRFQYNTLSDTRVTIRIFDFAMSKVADVVSQKSRPANGSFFETWNAQNYRGEIVANGVYFYSVALEGDGVYWGKFIVMD